MHITAKRIPSLLAIALTFMLVLFGCSESAGPVKDQQIDQAELSLYQGALAKGDINLANELRLKYFAKAVAKSLTIPGVGTFLNDEIGKKFDGDYDMLWETARDKEFPNLGRLRGLVASALKDMNSIVSIDEIEGVPLLQVALPVGFEEWDGETPIVVAYTPLTIDDVDVEEIYAYDSSGEEYILDGQELPDFPVMVVGINERVSANGDVFFSNMTGSDPTYAINALPPRDEDPPPPPPPPPPSPPVIKITKIDLDRDANDYEPWWKGDAELYFKVYDTEYAEGVVNEANIPWIIGLYSPEGSYKSYQCWKWEIYHYVQDKPWRTINLNTGWPAIGTFDFGRDYTLRVMEYDPFFYDGGTGNLCYLIALLIGSPFLEEGNVVIGGIEVDLGLVIGLATLGICNIVFNDDLVGEKDGFQSLVIIANNDQGTEKLWVDGDFKIKLLVE